MGFHTNRRILKRVSLLPPHLPDTSGPPCLQGSGQEKHSCPLCPDGRCCCRVSLALGVFFWGWPSIITGGYCCPLSVPTDQVGHKPEVILLIRTLLPSTPGLAKKDPQWGEPRAGHPHPGSSVSLLVLAFTPRGPKPLSPLPLRLVSFFFPTLEAQGTDDPTP